MSKISKYLFGTIIFFLITSGAIHFTLNLGAHITLFDLRFALILNLIFVFVSVVFCFLKGLKKSFGYLCFICTFSILILGQYFFGLFDKNIFGSFTFENTSTITYENELKSLYIILCSQLFVFLGYVALKDKNKEDNIIARKQCDSYYIKNIRFFSKIIMIFGFFPAFLKVVLTIIFVAKNGYLSLYLANSNAYLNPILDLFDGFYIVGVFSYLATYPTKKDSIKTLLVFAIFSFLTIFTGSRGQFVVNTIFIVWYLVKTNVLNISKKNKRRICFVGIPIAILLVSFLYSFGSLRLGSTENQGNIFSNLFRFVKSQGGTGRLIGLSIQNSKSISEYMPGIKAVIWPLKNFILNNSLMRIFTGGSLGQSQNNMIAFGDVLTYVTNTNAYLTGGSVGTCYVAELYCSGGLIFVAFGNFLIGFILSKIDNITKYSWTINVILYVVFTNVVYIARQAYLKVIPELLIYILVIIICNLCSGIKNGKEIQNTDD